MPLPSYWLIKSEPSAYSYLQLCKDKRTDWTGVRNFEARNNLRAMKKGELALYYHSVEEKALVGVAVVLGPARADPTAPGEDWAAVPFGPWVPLAKPVTLEQVKKTPALKDFALLTRSRLSVAQVTPTQFERVLKMAATQLP